MPIRAVFFDLDDTLCDTIGTREARARRAFKMLAPKDRRMTEEEFVGLVMEPTGDRIVRGVPAAIESLGLAGSAGRAAEAVWWFEGCLDLLCLTPGAGDALELLRRDYLLGIISNGDSKLQREKCRQLRLDSEVVVISGDCGFEKPDARIFQKACSLAEVEPPEAVFVGDRLDVDIAGAVAAGMRAVWFNPSAIARNGSSMADAVIARFDELPPVLRQLP